MNTCIRCVAVLVFAAQAGVCGAVDLGRQIDFAIPAQKLDAALMEFSRQAKVQVIASTAELQDLRSAGATGNLTLSEALKKLLANSGLAFKAVGESAVSVGRFESASPASAGSAHALDGSGEGGLRLVRVETGTDTSRAETGKPAAADYGDQQAVDLSGDEKGVPEMLVKGSRSSNIDIRRTEDDVQPYVVFTAEDIERSMATSLDRFLLQRLPMNTSRFTASDLIGSPSIDGNLSSIDLRGLGPNQTLILVNGRRMPGVSTSSDLSQPDINGIPTSSVERIEVLPSTAGGIYGGGATGGVINIILKNDYRGLEINARYDGTFRRDAAERVLEANASFALEGGRTTVMLSGSFRDSIPLLWGDREYAVRGRRQLLENNPDAILGSQEPPLGATSNIISTDGSPLVLASTGQSLGSNITHVPRGYAGPASDGGAALAANAGQYDLDWPAGTQGLGNGITSAPEVTSLRLNVHRSFTDRIEVFIDGNMSSNDSVEDSYMAAQSLYSIEPGTPNNPFLQPINVKFPGSDFDRNTQVVHNSLTLSFTGGVIVRLPRNWTVQGEYGWGRSEHDYALSLDSYLYYDAMYSGELNILSDVEVYPLDYSPYYPPVKFTDWQPEPYGSDMENIALRLAGPLIALPAGPVKLSALLEQRQNRMNAMLFQSYSVFDGTYGYQYNPSRKNTTQAGYIELTAPLITASNSLPLMRALDLQASYRLDRVKTQAVANTRQNQFFLAAADAPLPQVEYQTTSVEASQYTLGLRYQPTESLALRVSNAVGVLPPSLSQLVPSVPRVNSNYSYLVDRARNNTPVGVVSLSRTSGNPDLAPEHSDSWSAGAIFTPAFLPGLRFSVDYTRIRKTDEIVSLGLGQDFLNYESDFPDRVQRAPLTDADAALGYMVGRVQYLDLSQVNIAHTKVEAYDFRAGYRWSTAYGGFQFDAVATRQTHLQKQLLPATQRVDYVGFNYGPLKWRGNAGVTWERDAWVLGWNMQYFDSSLVYGPGSGTGAGLIVDKPTAILSQGSESFPRQVYHDLSFQYRIGKASLWGGMLSNTEILVGIANVLDTQPPPATYMGPYSGAFAPFQPPFVDPRLRRYSIAVRRAFGK